MTVLESPPPRGAMRLTCPTDEVGTGLATLPRTAGRYRSPFANTPMYAMTVDRLKSLLHGLPTGCRLGQSGGRWRFGMDVTYLDTPDLKLFRRSAHRRTPRFEVSISCSLDTGMCWLELSARRRSGPMSTARTRLDWDGVDASDGVKPVGHQLPWLIDQLATSGNDTSLASKLCPQLNVTLMRSFVLPPDGRSAVIDSDVVWRVRDGQTIRACDTVLVWGGADETWQRPQLPHPVRGSLYDLGMALSHPDAAGARWIRARHVIETAVAVQSEAAVA